jgi:hypothetical protein
MTPDEIRSLVEVGLAPNPNGEGFVCPVCNQEFAARSGWGPHKRKHLREVGDLPPVEGTPRKGKRKYRKKLDAEDACIGLLMGVTGRDSFSLVHLAAISKWIKDTERLLEKLK